MTYFSTTLQLTLIELTLSTGPVASIALDAAQLIAAPSVNRNCKKENGRAAFHDNVNHFLQEVNDANDIEEYYDEDLQELNEANLKTLSRMQQEIGTKALSHN